VLPQTAWDGLLREDWFQARYAPHHRIDELVLYKRRADAPVYRLKPSYLRFGQQIEITGVELGSPKAMPGEDLDLLIHWRTAAKLERDYSVSLALVDRWQGGVWAKADSQPMHGGAPTSSWLPGEDIADEHRLSIPSDAPYGPYQIWVGMSLRRTADAMDLPVYDGAGNSLGLTAPLVPIKVPPAHPSSCLAAMETIVASFSDIAKLESFHLEGVAQPGSTLAVHLCWQAMTSWADDRTVFVHMLDSQGNLVTQADGQPDGGRYPLSIWEAGESIPDTHSLRLPENLVPGLYQIRVGLYDWRTGERLPAFTAQTSRYPDDSVPLTTVQVLAQHQQIR